MATNATQGRTRFSANYSNQRNRPNRPVLTSKLLKDALQNLATARGINQDIQIILDALGVKFLNEATYNDVAQEINKLAVERGNV